MAPTVPATGPIDSAGYVQGVMQLSEAKDRPRVVSDKCFDHAGFEASRPPQRGYDLAQMATEAPVVPAAMAFEPYTASTLGSPLDTPSEGGFYDSYGSGYSDLRRAYQPDMQHHTQDVVEQSLEDVCKLREAQDAAIAATRNRNAAPPVSQRVQRVAVELTPESMSRYAPPPQR